ncbi:DUF2975 domain-containing protein [Flavobacteriaceae bacterium S356]|uniref:DUF2975 domain-containing protein n=1 Tax=Asprobacillus argus TaxID=3076534 RepID=A0ABU3LH73_9FLAO|nr:DUF2975 domain-containing protein [Flavobacteriaceae bacterium S356]
MKTKKTKKIILAMNIIAAIIFIALCAKTGAILYSFCVSLFGNSEGAGNLYLGLNLSDLYNFDITYYTFMGAFIIIISGLKAYLFFSVIKLFSRTNIEQPFSETIASLIKKMSFVAFTIGLFAAIAVKYSEWIADKGVELNTLFEYISGGEEFVFFGGILFMIWVVFKKGIEMQTENELTI